MRWSMFCNAGCAYLAIAIVLLVAGLDSNAARRRQGQPEHRLRMVLATAALWLPVLFLAMISVVWDAAASVRRR